LACGVSLCFNRPMNFAQRQAYCHELGIDAWVARRPLAGAAQGHLVVALEAASASYLPAVDARIAADSPSMHATVAQVVKPNNSRALMAELEGGDAGAVGAVLGAADSVAARRTAVDSALGRRVVSGTAPNATIGARAPGFQFEIMCRVHEQVLVIDDTTGLKFPPSAYNDWLHSIFYALGINDGQLQAAGVSKDDRLTWPPSTALGQPVSGPAAQQAASEMLYAWLQRKLQQAGKVLQPKKILVMGAAPSRLLLPEGSAIVAGQWAALPRFGGQSALLLHGSNRLWNKPLLKREFWQHLQSVESPR